MDLKYLVENSIAHSNLNEAAPNGTMGADIAQTDEIINAIIETKQYESLAYQICQVAPIHGPTGGTFALVYESDKWQLKRGEVVVEEDPMINTGFTKEAMQDLYTQFGKSATQFLARAFGGLSNMNENKRLLKQMAVFADSSANLKLSSSGNAETSLYQIQKKVAEIVIQINASSFKSLDTFVVLPAAQAAYVMALSDRMTNNKVAKGLYLGSNGRTNYYLNPDPSVTDIFVGVYSNTPGLSSMIMSPYFHTIRVATNPETGNETIFNFNRYAITESALSQSQKMIYKFSIS